MKKFILSAGMLISTLAYSQVGINNQDPKSTFDVTAKTTDGSKAEGFIAPRLTGNALSAAEGLTPKTYGTAQDGTIVYVTSAATTPGTGQTENITAAGYYYFDATADKWKSLLTAPSSGGTSSGGDSYKYFNNNTCYTGGPGCLYTTPAGTFASDEGKTIVFANVILQITVYLYQ